jgi:epoxyqueuosine reductase
MDASRCISYLTIEHRQDVSGELQPHMGDWVFGCDVCQEVCPHNNEAPTTKEPAYAPSEANPLPPRPLLDELAGWTEQDYRQHLAGSAMKRATLDMLRRNAGIALNNAASTGP